MKFLWILFFLLPFLSFSQVDFIWADSINDDFSFTEEWDYQEGIYTNQWGQLSCDGFCPMEIDRMKDNQGRIYDDSLTAFYKIIDTTHHYFTHQGTVRAYEYGECNYSFATEVNGKISVQTEVNISTHTSLHIIFDAKSRSGADSKIYLIYNSIRPVKPVAFYAESGTVEISKEKYKKGILQMRFDLKFEDVSNNPEFPQSWKGKIETTIP